MPRKARIDAPGAIHHIICRGIEGQNIFWDESDHTDFLQRLEKILDETNAPCFAWSLLPNHFHLLLRTGNAPIATVMLRLLSGYAGRFNRRHHRSGHLFQNRYKSILCQENKYLLELVRYIHLNPLRAGIVATTKQLDNFEYCGHGVLLGLRKCDWQEVDFVLSLFGKSVWAARRTYHTFIEKGIAHGKRPDLVGGGLLRSMGGWRVIQSLRDSQIHLKGDERILGDSNFVESVLKTQNERMEKRYKLQAQGWNFEKIVSRVADIFNIEADQILIAGKQPQRVKSRSLVCYWAVKELKMTATEVAKLLGLTQSAITKAAQRGEKLSLENKLELIK
jgi:REP element-mobilizing transposase RayT